MVAAMRSFGAHACIVVWFALGALPVSAQDAAASADEISPVQEAAPPAPPALPTPPPVPPVMVAVLSSGHVPDDVAAATQGSLVDGVRALAGGRPVLALAMPELRDRLAACADAACQGALLAESGAIGAVIARLSRRGTRGEIAMTLDILDPISGASRLPQLSLSLVDAATAPATLAPLVEQLRPVMFSPPQPPPTLLVTVNVDGATVIVDDVSVGESPIAAQRLTPGQHVVMITRAGYSGTRRTVELEPGEQERLDINLDLLDGVTTAEAASPSYSSAVPAATPWYEEWYVWAAVGGGLLVIAAVIVGVVIASQPTVHPDPMGIALPGLHF